MGKKTDPRSIDKLKLLIGVLLWGLATLGGTIYLLSPLPLPIQGMPLVVACVVVQFAFLWLISLFLLRNRLGKVSMGGLMAFAGSAFLFSSISGLLLSPSNIVFYLIPVLWGSSGSRWGKALVISILALVPETFQWINIYKLQINPVPKIPGGIDPVIFDWPHFFQNYVSIVWMLPVLALMMTRVKTTRVPTAFRSLPASSSLHKKADSLDQSPAAPVAPVQPPPVSLTTASFGTAGTVQIPQMDAAMVQNAQQNSDLRGILESIVFFMSKNFKANSALGLLSLDEGHTFVINAKFTKSNFMKDNVLVYPGSGMVGKAITESTGFMTGNLKAYGDKVEYYSKLEEVNSLLVSRIVDEETRKVMGLLVVDSQALRAFEDSDKELINRFSVIASKLISNARMRKLLESTASQNEVVYQISKLLAAENYTRGVIGVLIENLRRVFDADRLIVCDFCAETGQGRILKVSGDMGDVEEGQLFNLDDPFCLYGMAFINKIEYLETDVIRENRFRFRKEEKPEFSPSEVMIAPLLDEHGNVAAVIGLETNKSGTFQKRTIVLLQTILANASSALTRAQLFTKLEKQATLDGLTKIPNHRNFQDTLDKVLAKCTKERRPFAVLLMDIDHFKKFNDTYGHPVGDKVLQLVAAAVARTIRPNDFVARYGGEEFTVILDTDPAQLFQAAERVRTAVQAVELEIEGTILRVTVSIGASCFPLDGTVKKDLIEMADQAMYASKKNGRNRVTLWSPLAK